MKKAKILLTALTIITVVGGALAFKSANTQGTLFCREESLGAGECSDVHKYELKPVTGTPMRCTDVEFDQCIVTTSVIENDL